VLRLVSVLVLVSVSVLRLLPVLMSVLRSLLVLRLVSVLVSVLRSVLVLKSMSVLRLVSVLIVCSEVSLEQSGERDSPASFSLQAEASKDEESSQTSCPVEPGEDQEVRTHWSVARETQISCVCVGVQCLPGAARTVLGRR